MTERPISVADQPPYDASDPEQIAKRGRAKARADTAARNVVRNMLKTPEGRAWIWKLLDSCHVFGSGFVPDPHQHAYLAGERAVGMRVMNEAMQSDSELFVLMLKERGGNE